MRTSSAVCLTILLAATEAMAEPTTPFDESSWTSAMKRVLSGHASLDDRAITDVQSAGTCKTKFVTDASSRVIDWSKVKDFTFRAQGDGEEFEFTETGPHPTIAVPGENGSSLAFSGFTAIRRCFQSNAGS